MLFMEEEHSAGSAQYQPVARRYRPQTFEKLVGQEHIAQALSNAVKSGRIGHAYLFVGTRGTGKTTTARIFAKTLNCLSNPAPTVPPCGECDSCKLISTGEDIDAIEIDGASNNGVEAIRQLRANATIRPSRSRYKIYIIDEVHMLSKGAFNALLKILEEPPEHVKFIFCTTDPQDIPITVLSRCQRFDFTAIGAEEIADCLTEIAKKEGVTAEDGLFRTLARRAGGSMRDAQSLLEQLLSFAPSHISLADVHDVLGTANDQLLFNLLEAMLKNEPVKIFTELESAAAQGTDFGILVEQMLGLFRDLLVAASGGSADLLLTCLPAQFESVKTFAADAGLHRILAAMQILDQTLFRMQRSTQGRILTELALIRIANLDHFQQIAVLIDQLRSGQAASESLSVRQTQRQIMPPKGMALPVSAAPAGVASGIGNGMSDAAAMSVWQKAADAIPGMLGSAAARCQSVRLEMPNVFVALFDNKISKDLCKREMPRLQNMLSQTLGEAARIRLVLSEAEKPEETAVSPQNSYLENRERYFAA
ncbi:MAG: DNA polymerase III subunit gamma/tau, partial [Planctomycetaceae bacterium]|nr:DNA polymerase III subunit gamma/tau [Planctomycetaceae bacterium]